jgi:hypothetical protein
LLAGAWLLAKAVGVVFVGTFAVRNCGNMLAVSITVIVVSYSASFLAKAVGVVFVGTFAVRNCGNMLGRQKALLLVRVVGIEVRMMIVMVAASCCKGRLVCFMSA